MIGIIDYGMGNLRSVEKALHRLGYTDAHVIDSPQQVLHARKLILPGVGAFADAITNLRDRMLVGPILTQIRARRPFLGICLGMQLLFEISEEGGEQRGLGVLNGRVIRFQPTEHRFKVPHMGWNALRIERKDNPLFEGVDDGAFVYFVHSYYPAPQDPGVITTSTDYDGPFCSSIWSDNCFAMQFHPEKSQAVGLKILDNFAKL